MTLGWLLVAMAWADPVDPPAAPSPASVQEPAAPSLEGVQFLAQGPVQNAPITVVEVWATWCAPCFESFPTLSRLQADYGDRIRVVALTDDPPRKVRPVFQERAADMRFAVAVGSSEQVQALLFGGFGGRGIPSVYVLQEGRVLWGGEVAALEAALVRHVGSP